MDVPVLRTHTEHRLRVDSLVVIAWGHASAQSQQSVGFQSTGRKARKGNA